MVSEIQSKIKTIYELTGIQYVLLRDNKYGYKICVLLNDCWITIFRGSLRKLNDQITGLEYSAKYWSTYLDS